MTRDLEGKVHEEHGYCLLAGQNEHDPLGEGLIDDEGNAIFSIKYSALYFNLFDGEVADGIVTDINEVIPGIILFLPFSYFKIA